jgi:hypothetical protein
MNRLINLNVVPPLRIFLWAPLDISNVRNTFYKNHAMEECYRSIILACEYMHTDGAELASLAGSILLEITSQVFY